jgi:hypothetical protein
MPRDEQKNGGYAMPAWQGCPVERAFDLACPGVRVCLHDKGLAKAAAFAS